MDDIPLKEFFLALLNEQDKRNDQRFKDLEKATLTAMQASEKAILKAETASEKRFEAVNEFRQTVTDITANNVSKSEAQAVDDRLTAAIARNAQDIRSVTDRQNVSQGRGLGQTAMWGYAIGALGVVFAVLSFFQ